jgi:hypothetical protein
MYKLGEKILTLGQSFVHNDILYPRNWLQKSTQAEKDALGITWEDDPVRADDRYYWDGDVNNPKALDDVNEVDEDGNPIYVQEYDATANNGEGGMVDTDEQLVTRGLKYTMKQQVKDTAGKLLAQTDWYVVRNSEKSTAIPADVTTKRDAIRTECDRLETAIDGATTVDALKTVMESQDWGE